MLTIQNLTVAYPSGRDFLPVVRDFSLTIRPGQTYGLVGESGSGKTTVAMAIMRYLPGGGKVLTGRVEFDGRDLLTLSTEEVGRLWGREISLVPQDPLSSLNPSIRIGEQLAEGLRLHMGMTKAEAQQRAVELLRQVRIPDPERVARSYPHQISGGMQQRVLIAMAFSAEPKLLVLDEPTTSLDVTTQAAVLDLLQELIRERETAVLYITHNLGIVAQICDHVAVLYAGELVENAATDALFQRPLHPYTQGLLDSVPKIGRNKTDVRLSAIPGKIPPPAERDITGCIFAPRCALALPHCLAERPPLEQIAPGLQVRCHRWEEIASGEIALLHDDIVPLAEVGSANGTKVLELKELSVIFTGNRTLLEAIRGRAARRVHAVDGVDLTINRRQTLGLVGESGSGKTSLARAAVGLVTPSSGEIELLGDPLPPKLSQRQIDTLQLVQYVFQNPEEALNPFLTVGETLRRPLMTLLRQSKADAETGAVQLLAAVGLPPEYMRVLPGRLSGGEKQRVAIARAFAAAPDLLLADEPVSALDVSVQASILNLLSELQGQNDSAMLFISHDLAVVGYLADKIAVMYAGALMEVAATADLFTPPYHPYTEALLSAVPVADPAAPRRVIRLEGDATRHTNVPTGCRFHPRCPRYLGDICRDVEPPWQVTEQGDRIYCHIPLSELRSQQSEFWQVEEEQA